jgi:D-methionine transport system substrate-binding protein
MKKILALVLALALTLSLTAALADPITIAVPNDPTNEGRALLLLQSNGVLTLKEGVGLEATKLDVESTAVEIELIEVEASTLPEYKLNKDVDYAIINNNFALDAGLNPVKDSLAIESADSPYVNVISVKAGNENTDAAKALVAAATSQQVVDYINEKYAGSAVATIENPTNGYDDTVDYAALNGTTISIAATAVPHEEVLKDVVAPILAEKGITLDVREVTDYVTPNTMVDGGDVFANYFAHQPYQDSFNKENGTDLVTIAGIHVEPMALYGGKQETLDALKPAK